MARFVRRYWRPVHHPPLLLCNAGAELTPWACDGKERTKFGFVWVGANRPRAPQRRFGVIIRYLVQFQRRSRCRCWQQVHCRILPVHNVQIKVCVSRPLPVPFTATGHRSIRSCGITALGTPSWEVKWEANRHWEKRHPKIR